MKKIYLLIFFILLGCGGDKKVYICGDHPCKDKKEIDDYFKNNISIEVYVMETSKNKKDRLDLVDINLLKEKTDQTKNNKELAFLSKRKKENATIIKKEKPTKLNLKVKRTEENEISSFKKDQILNKPNKTFNYKNIKTKKIVHLCKRIDECDINVISKKISELGKEKNFPDLTISK